MAKLLSGTIVYGTATIQSTLFVSGSTSATSTTTGALQVVGGVGIGANLVVGGNITATTMTVNGLQVGYLNIPQNAQTSTYTIALSDAGGHIYHALGTSATTYTIPANSVTAFITGTAVTFINSSVNPVNIAITSDTLQLSPGGSTGTRTLAQYGVATAIKIQTSTWIISGTGLT